MNINIPTAAALSAAAVMVLITVTVICYFVKRERRVMNRLQQMLDDAVQSKFRDIHLDETKLSAVENSMWRYLCDNQTAFQKLKEEKERLQELVSDLTHQAVTPVANILLYTQLLEEWQSDDGENRKNNLEAIAAVREQAEKMDFLMESLLKLSRLETGMIKVTAKKQRIEPVFSAIQKQYAVKAAEKQIQLTVENTEESAVFDLKWTIEALANVVDNALKYTPCGGRVVVKAEPYSFFIRIDVSDTGIGIPESEQASVFTRFYRSDAVSEKPGMGIGLYLAREVMKAQNGYIKLSSKEGKGCVLSLFLSRT